MDVSKRLDEVQEAVLGCLTIVADVMDILSASESATEQQLRSKCINYLQNIKISQVRDSPEPACQCLQARRVQSQPLSATEPAIICQACCLATHSHYQGGLI